jgi:hypothetical protein
MDYETALKILNARLSFAEEQEKEASTRFNEVIRSVPSGIPGPDGTARVQLAARIYRNALCELQTAQRQMADFLLTSIVPEGLDQPERIN